MHFVRPARRLRIAFINDEVDQHYGAMLAAGVSDAARRLGVDVVMPMTRQLGNPEGYVYQYGVTLDFIDPKDVDGVIVAGGTVFNLVPQEEYDRLASRFAPRPTVSIGRTLAGCVSVTVDNTACTARLVEHLVVQHGCRNIGLLSGPQSNPDAFERREAFLAALAALGIPFDPGHEMSGDYSLASGRRAGQHFLDRLSGSLDAVVSANDSMAIGLSQVLQAAGLRIPGDLALAGFDDIFEAGTLAAPLTTIRQPIREMGQAALEACVGIIRGEAVASRRLPAELIIRESCGCPPSYISDLMAVDPRGLSINSLRERLVEEAARHPGIDRFALASLLGVVLNIDSAELAKLLDEDRNRRVLTRAFDALLLPASVAVTDFHFLSGCLDQVRGFLVRQFPLDPARNHAETLIHAFRTHLGDLRTYLLEQRHRRHQADSRALGEALSAMIDSLASPGQMFRSLVPALRGIGIQDCQVWLYERPVRHAHGDKWHMPKQLHSVLTLSDGQAPDEAPGNRPLPQMKAADLVSRLPWRPEAASQFVLYPLFVLEEQLGVLACSYNLELSNIFDTLMLQTSMAVKLSSLMRHHLDIEHRLHDSLRHLEQSHDNLALMSNTDELTKLLNRRGFMDRLERILSIGAITGLGGLLCFADMDGLKTINDTWGHDAGDEAIVAMAEILRKTFRSDDSIARIGGDEFTIIILDSGMEQDTVFRNRLDHLLHDWNLQSGRQWRLDITLGSVDFEADGILTASQLMRMADEAMYELKRMKKGTKD
jgi:diguanylate cyclase (GGDEF)-like protein